MVWSLRVNASFLKGNYSTLWSRSKIMIISVKRLHEDRRTQTLSLSKHKVTPRARPFLSAEQHLNVYFELITADKQSGDLFLVESERNKDRHGNTECFIVRPRPQNKQVYYTFASETRRVQVINGKGRDVKRLLFCCFGSNKEHLSGFTLQNF